MKNAPAVKKVAPVVLGAMMEPAMRMALNSLHNYNQKSMTGAEAFEDHEREPILLRTHYSAAIDQPTDRRTDAFIHGVQKAIMHGQESTFDADSEEGFFDTIKAGARLAGKGLVTAGKFGLPLLAKAVEGAESAGAESFDGASVTHAAQVTAAGLPAQDLAERALVGEAAL